MASLLAAEELGGSAAAGSFEADSALNAPAEESGSGGFKKDSGNNALLGGFGLSEAGKGINSILGVVKDAYSIYRANKRVGQENRDNILNRYRAGIVF